MKPSPSPDGVDPIVATRMALARIASELQQIDAQLAALGAAPPAAADVPEQRPGQLLKTDEASEYLGVPTATLRYWRSVGTGPQSGKLGRRVVYRRADLEGWLGEQLQR